MIEPEDRIQISAYIDNELDPQEKKKIEEKMIGSIELRAYCKDLIRQKAAIHHLFKVDRTWVH